MTTGMILNPGGGDFIEVTRGELRQILRGIRRATQAVENGNVDRALRVLDNNERALQEVYCTRINNLLQTNDSPAFWLGFYCMT
ncbi:MAG: hypothetical protein R2827_13435 [Bdellovibrionales bacterium]